MKKISALLAALTLGGCASIVSDSEYGVAITSSPTGADFTIKNSKGIPIHSGTTPMTVLLDASDGYFDGAEYLVIAEKDGYQSTQHTIEHGLDGWFLGNIFLFGGWVGMLVVDPLTGALYTLPDNANIYLPPVTK